MDGGTVTKELTTIIEEENELIYRDIEKRYLKNILNSTKKDKYLKTIYVLQLLLDDNSNYLETIFDAVEIEFSEFNPINHEPEKLDKINRLTGYLITELLFVGYSKSFLYNTFWGKFIANVDNKSFTENYSVIKTLMDKRNRNYTIIYQIRTNTNNLSITNSNILTQTDFDTIIQNSNENTKNFLNFYNRPKNKYLIYKREGLDNYSSQDRTRADIAEIIDILHLGYQNDKIKLHEHVLVIDDDNSQFAKTQRVNYSIDGKYESGESIYNNFVNKITDINSNEKITLETKQKLKSAIRYLRLGNDALELEQKFISYWSGLESLFSNYNPDENNFARLSTIFPICHKIWYLKRNLIEFDRDIKRLGVTNDISNFSNTDISYLSNCEVYDEIITKFKTDNPLLAFRALSLKLVVENDKDRMKILENHSQNLQWNIARAYRIRNEIIHDAVINSEIVHITSHLKYYLIFILNSLLDFLSSSPIDINKDNKIDLDDFYTLQIIKSDNYEIKKYKVTDII